MESCWDDVCGTGENEVSGGWEVVEKKVLRSSDFCRSVLADCSPCWSTGIVECCLLRYLIAFQNVFMFGYIRDIKQTSDRRHEHSDKRNTNKHVCLVHSIQKNSSTMANNEQQSPCHHGCQLLL